MTRVSVCAVGRLRKGPELELIRDYVDRFNRTGRPMGLGPLEIVEVEDKKRSGMAGEAELLRRALPAGALICALDERGKTLSSPDFAQKLRDDRAGLIADTIAALKE